MVNFYIPSTTEFEGSLNDLVHFEARLLQIDSK